VGAFAREDGRDNAARKRQRRSQNFRFCLLRLKLKAQDYSIQRGAGIRSSARPLCEKQRSVALGALEARATILQVIHLPWVWSIRAEGRGNRLTIQQKKIVRDPSTFAQDYRKKTKNRFGWRSGTRYKGAFRCPICLGPQPVTKRQINRFRRSR